MSTKAEEIAKELADELTARNPYYPGATTLTVTFAFHTDGNPYLTVGPGTNGSRTAIIKIVPQSFSSSKNSLGSAQEAFAPHKIMIAKEANNTAGAGADPLQPGDLLCIYGVCMMRGCKVELWQSAAGAAPTITTFDTGSNLVNEVYPDVRRPLLNQI